MGGEGGSSSTLLVLHSPEMLGAEVDSKDLHWVPSDHRFGGAGRSSWRLLRSCGSHSHVSGAIQVPLKTSLRERTGSDLTGTTGTNIGAGSPQTVLPQRSGRRGPRGNSGPFPFTDGGSRLGVPHDPRERRLLPRPYPPVPRHSGRSGPSPTRVFGDPPADPPGPRGPTRPPSKGPGGDTWTTRTDTIREDRRTTGRTDVAKVEV